MRYSFSSRYEVAHLWAHQLQEEARYSGGNFYFYGNTIYSYGSHFPCGKIVQNKHGQKIYMLNSKSYSNTTAKHQNEVAASVPRYGYTFYSPSCISPDSDGKYNSGYHEAVTYILHKLSVIIALMKREKNARTVDYTIDIYSCCLDVNRWIQLWDLDKRQKWSDGRLATKPDIFSFFASKSFDYSAYSNSNWDIVELVECWRLFNDNQMFTGRQQDSNNLMHDIIRSLVASWFGEACRQKLEKRTKKWRTTKVKKELKEELKKLEEWHKGERRSIYLTSLFKERYFGDTALRITNGQIETSKGIFLDMEEGKRLWKAVSLMEKSGTFRRNIVNDASGYKWKFDRYKNHVLYAGCHSIPFSECQRIANQMGW